MSGAAIAESSTRAQKHKDASNDTNLIPFVQAGMNALYWLDVFAPEATGTGTNDFSRACDRMS